MKDLELAKQTLHADARAFVLVKDERVLACGTRDGIGELLDTLDWLGEAARGASLADKVVGKAVAQVAVHAGLRAIYTPLASEAARRVLDLAHISLDADHVILLILNKRGDGACPMERLTAPLDSPHDAVNALREFVEAQHAHVVARAP